MWKLKRKSDKLELLNKQALDLVFTVKPSEANPLLF